MTDAEYAELKGILERLDERTDGMKNDVDSIKHVLLEGNGSPALTVQVATMDTRLKNVEDTQKDEKVNKSVPRQVSISIVVSILLGLVGVAAAIIGK